MINVGFASNRLAVIAGLAAVFVLALTATIDAQKSPPGYYTRAQAASGAAVYSARCQQCHGVNLQGQAGPALVGPVFQAYVGKSGTAATLYDFTSRQMPADAPGTLTQQQYLDVTAFILSRNGYPAGNLPLTTATLSQVADDHPQSVPKLP